VATDRRITRRIPLAIGTNNIAIDVVRDDELASVRAIVVRRRSQLVRAVIVGVDEAEGAPPLDGAVADARRMNDLLLRYTDAVPTQIRLLAGRAATKQKILDAITDVGTAREDAVVPPDSPGSTFLLYFAGYGLSLESPEGG